jgi:hypothetical protein
LHNDVTLQSRARIIIILLNRKCIEEEASTKNGEIVKVPFDYLTTFFLKMRKNSDKTGIAHR